MSETCQWCGADNRSCGTWREYFGPRHGNTSRLVQSPRCRIRELEQQNEKLALDAELVDFMDAFNIDVFEVDAGKGWMISTLVVELLYWAKTHGPWKTAKECLTACRDWQVSEGTGWANRRKPTDKGA